MSREGYREREVNEKGPWTIAAAARNVRLYKEKGQTHTHAEFRYAHTHNSLIVVLLLYAEWRASSIHFHVNVLDADR